MDNDQNKISDYRAVGLNKYMMPLSSPIADPGSFIGGMDFNTYFDRNTVTAINLRNFSFNAGTGGTIVLGGANNGNGNFILKDSAGNTIVTGNNQGLIVTNGSITINNASGSLSLDSSGIVSTANFVGSSLFNGAVSGGTTTGTSYIDVPGGAIGSIVATRSLRVAIYLMAYGYNSDLQTSHGIDIMEVIFYDSFSSASIMNLLIPGQATTYTPDGLTFFQNVRSQMLTRFSVVDVAAGTHSYKLQFRSINGGTATLNAIDTGFVILGN